MVATLTKTAIWVIRFFQWTFAIIIVGETAYLIQLFLGFSSHGPREAVVPLIFSVLAILFTTFSAIALYFLDYTMQLVSALLDFILWVGYLASAGLLRRNFYLRGIRNNLWQKIYYGRIGVGHRPYSVRVSSLVRMLGALVVIQIILFFFTMLLQLWAAKKYKDEQRLQETRPGHSEKRLSRSTNASDHVAPANDSHNLTDGSHNPTDGSHNPAEVNRV